MNFICFLASAGTFNFVQYPYRSVPSNDWIALFSNDH
jgi:hypothetical protein